MAKKENLRLRGLSAAEVKIIDNTCRQIKGTLNGYSVYLKDSIHNQIRMNVANAVMEERNLGIKRTLSDVASLMIPIKMKITAKEK